MSPIFQRCACLAVITAGRVWLTMSASVLGVTAAHCVRTVSIKKGGEGGSHTEAHWYQGSVNNYLVPATYVILLSGKETKLYLGCETEKN